jgi:hypothetical protein
MIEGKWLKIKKEKKEVNDIKDYEDFGIRTRLITYDEEKEWIEKEKSYVRTKKDLDS